MKTIKNYMLISMFAFFFISCEENPVEPNIPNDIQSFVNKLQLNKTQEIKILLAVKNEDVYVFIFSYGDAQDCPSGCFYAQFIGLKNKEKIGEYENYDIDSTERYLFSEDFSTLLKEKDEQLYYNIHLPLLASDINTPTNVLLSITHILYNYISTHIAYKLLENPVVQQNVEILTLLANLPVFQGDSYENIREIAKNLLNGN